MGFKIGAMSYFYEYVLPLLYRASIYFANSFLDDPAMLAFAFC
jgi:hypothetical protein